MRQLGSIGILVFIGAYAIATVLFLPGWIFTVTAGLLFGVVGGTVIALGGAVIGAALAFLVARYLVRGRVQDFTRLNSRFEAIDRAIGENGWKIDGCMPLSQLMSFNFSKYFIGCESHGNWSI